MAESGTECVASLRLHCLSLLACRCWRPSVLHRTRCPDKADDAKLGRKPPKASGTPKHPTASQGTREKVTVRWTKHVRLDNLAELEKYDGVDPDTVGRLRGTPR